MNLDLDQVSRLVLSLTCLTSATAATCLAILTHPRYAPHMVLVAFWSVWAGLAMLDLAYGGLLSSWVPTRYLVLNLNSAFTVTVGGWALFATRLWREAVVVKRAERRTGNAMKHALEDDRVSHE